MSTNLIELQIPTVLAFYEEMQQQLTVLEKLLDNPSVFFGLK
jgi:hypothetical protein